MAHAVRSLAAFVAVAVLAGGLTITGLNYTADTIAQVASTTRVKTTNLKPSYVAYLPPAKAVDLDIAKSVPVVPPKPAPALAAVAPAALPAQAETTTPTFTHTVAVDALRVRSGPNKSNPHVFTLKGGTSVNVSDNVRGWVLVMDQSGRRGWVYGKLLQPAARSQ